MPDSLHTASRDIQPAATPSQATHHGQTENFADISLPGPSADEAMVRELISAHTSPVSKAKKQTAAPATHQDTSTSPDTIEARALPAKAPRTAITLQAPDSAARVITADHRQNDDNTASWVITGMLILFLLVAFRMRRNLRYLKSMLRETVNSRTRQNMFADTARETTFAILLNLLCMACCGLLLAQGAELWRTGQAPPAGHFPDGLWTCTGLSCGFHLLQWLTYSVIGHTFTTRAGANLWLQGFRAGSGLLGLALFPLSMAGVFYPQGIHWVLTAAMSLYFLSRLLFIFKGIRIFSAHRTYYILFLYYLCSVEAVPLILIWHTACQSG